MLLIILAIIITSNINSKNNNLASEEYFATTNANSNLIASYIKEGVKVGGITGTLKTLDTSDATATAADIAKGKTAYVKGKKIIGTRIDTVAQAKEAQQAFSENKILIDDYGNNVKVPAGFKISEDSATSVTGGVVIEDVSAGDENTKGSQFVWIPVGDNITDESGSKTTITLGRYEAGDAYATSTARTDSTSDSNPVVCKSGVYPYNNVTQSQASILSQGMYNSSNFESDLVNSYAWDTAIVFIQTFSGDTNYSRQDGKNTRVDIQRCGESILYSVDGGDKPQDVRCNIYDMAGNTRELTTESYSDSRYPCVPRGGYYGDRIYYTSGRIGSCATIDYDAYGSFRLTLYL